MRTTRTQSGFGLHDTTRQISRRRQRPGTTTETGKSAPLVSEAEILADLLACTRKFKRPLAA